MSFRLHTFVVAAGKVKVLKIIRTRGTRKIKTPMRTRILLSGIGTESWVYKIAMRKICEVATLRTIGRIGLKVTHGDSVACVIVSILHAVVFN